MLKSYCRSAVYSIGLVSIIFIIMSLVWSSIKVSDLYEMVGIVIPVHLFSFFTFELKLFSKNIWIRRAIVITFSILALGICGYITGSLRLELKSLIIYGVTALICIMISVFSYYVIDKIEQRNLELINQKLREKNISNINIG